MHVLGSYRVISVVTFGFHVFMEIATLCSKLCHLKDTGTKYMKVRNK
jgi:hypothetical protein